MAASRKLRTAHFLMFIGVAPLVFAAAVATAAIAFARSQPGQAGGSDGFLVVALGVFGYLTTLVLGGSGALWSLYLTSRRIDARATATVVLRASVLAGLVLPLLSLAWFAWQLR